MTFKIIFTHKSYVIFFLNLLLSTFQRTFAAVDYFQCRFTYIILSIAAVGKNGFVYDISSPHS